MLCFNNYKVKKKYLFETKFIFNCKTKTTSFKKCQKSVKEVSTIVKCR